MRKATFIVLLLLLFISNISAQDTLTANGRHFRFIEGRADTVKNNGNAYIVKYIEEPDEAYVLRSNGKIYVVVTVLATIFAGIFTYLVVLDRKISRLEREKTA